MEISVRVPPIRRGFGFQGCGPKSHAANRAWLDATGLPVQSSSEQRAGQDQSCAGLLSFLGCSIISGIPAIITGHIAHNRSRKAPQQFGGGGLAVAGLVMGYLSLALIPVIAILAGLMLPALAKAKDRAQRINCVSNMKQIGLAARMWSNDHGGKFPPDFASMSNELATPKILVCPGDSSKTRAMNWSEFEPGNLTSSLAGNSCFVKRRGAWRG